MKKVFLMGSMMSDVYGKVTRMPKGNEDFNLLEKKTRVSGSALTCASILNGFSFPFDTTCMIGTGVYGEPVADYCHKENIPFVRSEDTAGCTMTLVDVSGQKSVFKVPGCEYEVDEEQLLQLDPSEIGLVVVFDDILTGGSCDELLRALEDLNVPILAVLSENILGVPEEVLDGLFALEPSLFVGKEAMSVLVDGETDLADLADDLYEETQASIFLPMDQEGIYCRNVDGSFIAPNNKRVNVDHVIGAFVTAMIAGVDEKNALMFALHFGTLRSKGLPTAFDYEEQKHRLVEILKGC